MSDPANTTPRSSVKPSRRIQNQPNRDLKVHRQRIRHRVPPLAENENKERVQNHADSLGFCQTCEANDCFNYFNPGSRDGGRSRSDQSTVQWRQKSILDNFLLVMRFGTVESTDELLQVVSEDRMGAKTIHCIWKNVMTLLKSGVTLENSSLKWDSSPSKVTNLDTFLATLPTSKPQDRSDPVIEISVPASFRTNTLPSLQSSTSSGSKSNSSASWTPPSEQTDEGSPQSSNYQNACKGLRHNSTTANGEIRKSSDTEASHGIASLMLSPTSRSFPAAYTSSHRARDNLDREEFTYKASPSDQRSRYGPADIRQRRVLDLPILEPISDFSNFCVSLRNNSREALANGTEFGFLSNWGRMECELLFRDRIESDPWHIPNWACEMSRRLPPMYPATRIALALCLYRMMMFLIAPSEKALSELPEILQPTDHQMRIPHDISVSFIPQPQMRNILVHRPADWLTLLALNNFRLEWTNGWGDVAGATLSHAGMWQSRPHNIDQGLKDDDEDMWGFDPFQAAKESAIVLDKDTGRRYVSNDFQRHCWKPENWSISRNILRPWPELQGHIELVKHLLNPGADEHDKANSNTMNDTNNT